MHMEPPPIPLIKINPNDNLDKDFVEIKFLRYPTSENSYLYEFKMNLFDNGYLEEFLLFVCKFSMTLVVPGKILIDAKVKHIFTIVHVEALRQFDLLSYDVEGTEPLTVETIILGLAS